MKTRDMGGTAHRNKQRDAMYSETSGVSYARMYVCMYAFSLRKKEMAFFTTFARTFVNDGSGRARFFRL
jgi:hypothetical protein